MSVFNHLEFDHHEVVNFVHDPASGLKAIIAIHSTSLGPAAGGCRRWQYAQDADALTDALRLSRGMTYKNAVAGLPFGGGKSVILADDAIPKSAVLFAAFGRAVDSLNGCYITAEDVGISVADMQHVRRETRYVSGLPQGAGRAGGDPSPWTACGVFLGINAAVESRLGAASVKGLRIAVQGVGQVGRMLCHFLHEAGAELVVADVNESHLNRIRKELPVSVVPPGDVLYSDVDVLAPCALGKILDAGTIPRIRAKVVAGAANNQLATEEDGQRLVERGILYAPDYVINAGGIISAAREYLGQSSEDEVREEIARIPERLRTIFTEAKSAGRAPDIVADEWARRLVSAGAAERRPDAERKIA